MPKNIRINTNQNPGTVTVLDATEGDAGLVPSTGPSWIMVFGNITPANGAGNRVIAGYTIIGANYVVTGGTAPTGRPVLRVFETAGGGDVSADYGTVLNGTNQIAQLGGNHAGDAPVALMYIYI